MRNPLTFEVEGYMGAAFIALLGGFLIAFFFIAIKNFNTDVDILNSSQASIKTISPTERGLIDNWLRDTGTEIPAGKGYRYIINAYPDKPWFRANETE